MYKCDADTRYNFSAIYPIPNGSFSVAYINQKAVYLRFCDKYIFPTDPNFFMVLEDYLDFGMVEYERKFRQELSDMIYKITKK